VFTAQESVEFLRRRAPRVAAGPDPEAAVRIARRCGHLPLALGLVAAHMGGTPGWTLTDHAERLDEHHGNQRLSGGVEVALAISYDRLSSDQQRLLRMVAIHPGQDFDAHAAAALAETDLATARARLSLLCRDNLLQQTERDRYTLHDLVRVFAANRAGDEDRPAARRAALTRLFDYYLAAAATAMDALAPSEAHRRPRAEPPAAPAPVIADAEDARRWLDTERPTLVSVAQHTAANGWTSHTTRLSATLFRYLNSGPQADGLSIHGHALRAAEQDGDLHGQMHALNALGMTYSQLGHFGPAAEHLTRALELHRLVDDPAGRARTLGNLGVVELGRGNHRAAAGHHDQTLRLFQQIGDLAGEAYSHLNLGVAEERLGRYPSAADHGEHALRLFRQLGDLAGEATALTDLGIVHQRCGEYSAADKQLQLALALFRRVGHRAGEAWTLDILGTLATRLDQPDRAADCHRQALAIYRDIGDRHGVAAACNGLGEAARSAGDAAAALACHTDALDAAGRIRDRCEQARAHSGLGSAHEALGDRVHARRHHRQALALYTDLDMPQAAEIRSRLRTVDTGGRDMPAGRGAP
jgi:tetratricopeptide (TPR) repeat protein